MRGGMRAGRRGGGGGRACCTTQNAARRRRAATNSTATLREGCPTAEGCLRPAGGVAWRGPWGPGGFERNLRPSDAAAGQTWGRRATTSPGLAHRDARPPVALCAIRPRFSHVNGSQQPERTVRRAASAPDGRTGRLQKAADGATRAKWPTFQLASSLTQSDQRRQSRACCAPGSRAALAQPAT